MMVVSMSKKEFDRLEVLLGVETQGQLGLFTFGPGKVMFDKGSVTEEPGKVFVVIPFKDYYIQDLFADVIKPIVEEQDNT